MRIFRLARRFALVPGLLAALAAVGPRPALGDDPKPAKKDSRSATRPAQVTFSTRITPAEAKAGDTVTLAVTATLEPGWHVYGYSKDQPDDGPRVTQFDLFGPSGLVPKGDWSPSPAPVKKKDDAFPGLPSVSYHEGEVTWSRTLTVPADAAPGKKSIRVQAGYQVCSEQTCSFPGQWTLPVAELTIVPKGGEPPKVDPSLARAGGEAPAAAKPSRKDTRASAKPKTVEVTASIEPKQAKAGETVTLKVTAKPAPGWHIYTYSKAEAETGPKLTGFDLFDPSGLVPQGDWSASREPIRRKDPAFADVSFLEFYEDEVTWSLPLAVPPGVAPGPRSIRLQAGYMVCSNSTCSQPGQWTLPAIELAVVAGGTAVASAPTAAPAPKADPAPPSSTPEPAGSPAPSVQSEVERQAGQGLLPFLATCALGGLVALVMPCVWPMVPITVNFFVKQGQKKKGAATGLAVAYCLAIIGVFTGVGVLFSAFFGAASLSKLANNPWVNFGVAALFIAFGLSLLGLFEIRLPNFLLNASAQQEGRGGMVGVMFMALTLTITSFTCTFPVVGGLLVMAAGGSYLYPVIGLATFATVLALPFFALALSPGMLSKMPKSGDWMNTVKVVGGLIEIGAAFKFLNTAEVSWVVPKDAFFNAFTVLAIWVVLALVCGIYLLGLFRTDHDQEAVRVGPGRLVIGCGFLCLALFLAPALFGRPPQSKIWYLVVGLLPADAGDLKAPAGGSGPAAEGGEVVAQSKDPKQATREQRSFHGVAWGFSFEAAAEESRKVGKPILIDFTGVNCANCRLMEQEVLPRPEVVDVLKRFVTVQLYTDRVPIPSIGQEARESLAEDNSKFEEKLTRETTNPLYVVVTPDEVLLGARGGKMPPGEFTQFLMDALARHAGTGKVARAGGAN